MLQDDAQRLRARSAFHRQQRLAGKLHVNRAGNMQTCIRHRQRLVRNVARNPDRQQLHPAADAVFQKTLLVRSAPREHLVRVDLELAGHSRHRRSRRQRRLHDPTLLLNRETMPPTASACTTCVQFHRFRMKQFNSTKQTDSPDAYNYPFLWTTTISPYERQLPPSTADDIYVGLR